MARASWMCPSALPIGMPFPNHAGASLCDDGRCFASLDNGIRAKVINVVVGAFARMARLLPTRAVRADQGAIPVVQREPFECLIVLLHATICVGERHRSSAANGPPFGGTAALPGGKKGAGGGGKAASGDIFEWVHFRAALLDAILMVTASPGLGRIYQSSSDFEQAISILVKSTHVVLEVAENLKIAALATTAMDILANCSARLGYKGGMETIIMQDLNYFDHLAEFNADLLARIGASVAFNNDTSLLDATLHNLGGNKFTGDDGAAVKIVSAFLLRLVRVDPRNVLRNVSLLAGHVDSESYTLRMAMLEVFATLILHLHKQEERTDQVKAQTRSFLGAIEERLRDVNAFVRCKVLSVLSDLVSENAIPVASRCSLVELVIGRVMDKSSNVRRRAIQLLGEFLRTHPFCIDGGELCIAFFEERLKEIDALLDRMAPAEVKLPTIALTGEEEDGDGQSGGDEQGGSKLYGRLESAEALRTGSPPMVAASEDGIDHQRLQTLLLQKRYYSDAKAFVRQLDSVIPTLCRLLSSSTKTEVFEVMDFFVDAHIYKLQSSTSGIKKMMHLIWERDLSSEDGSKRSVKEHVLVSYKKVFLEVDASISAGQERIEAVARNMISLVRSSSPAELASLEQIVVGFVKKEWISDGIVSAIGRVLTRASTAKGGSSADQVEHRCALIALTMIGLVRPAVIQDRVEVILRVGLGTLFPTSDPWLSEYACAALCQLVGGCSDNGQSPRLPNDNIIFGRLVALIGSAPVTFRWLQVVAQAIKSIYLLADQPGLIASALIKGLSEEILPLARGEHHIATASLAKVLFVAGHVATCELTHLDVVERHWKEAKAASVSPLVRDSSLAGITASADDDIIDVVRYVRESELLYGEGSVLAVYGQVAGTICANNVAYPDRLLQGVAAITLGKFMTVSGKYCDEHLALFLTILERSPDALVRGNLTILFADIAQVFSRIVDANIVYLFRRLRDPSVRVKRNAIMVLTHLTLTGMIKVKGQIGEIAKCILDADKRVADLARLFFHELAGKDNAIYNHIPDMISSLSPPISGREEDGDEGGDDVAFREGSGRSRGAVISEGDFCTIARFIFDFVKKERQMEGLVEKVCQRLRQCSPGREARDLSYCLTLVNYTSDRTCRRLIESFAHYKDHLIDGGVARNFLEVVQKMKKATKSHQSGAPTSAQGGGPLDARTSFEAFEQAISRAASECEPVRTRRERAIVAQGGEEEDDDEDCDGCREDGEPSLASPMVIDHLGANITQRSRGPPLAAAPHQRRRVLAPILAESDGSAGEDEEEVPMRSPPEGTPLGRGSHGAARRRGTSARPGEGFEENDEDQISAGLSSKVTLRRSVTAQKAAPRAAMPGRGGEPTRGESARSHDSPPPVHVALRSSRRSAAMARTPLGGADGDCEEDDIF